MFNSRPDILITAKGESVRVGSADLPNGWDRTAFGGFAIADRRGSGASVERPALWGEGPSPR